MPTTHATRFGRPKFGGTQGKLLALSALAGALLACALGAVTALFAHPERPLLAFGIYAACLTPVAAAGSWALMVDRSTIRGATKNPEDSIETHWYAGAAEDTFHVLLVGVGVLGIVSSFWDFHVSGSTLTVALGGALMATFVLCYYVRKHREG